MRKSRIRHKLEAARELRSENARLVERLCAVNREAETRQKHLMQTPRTWPGMLNAAFRRKVAHQVDKDNKMMLDRLKHAGPGIETNRELASKYKVHQELVVRHSRIKRRDVDLTNPPAPPPRRPTKAVAPKRRNLPPIANSTDNPSMSTDAVPTARDGEEEGVPGSGAGGEAAPDGGASAGAALEDALGSESQQESRTLAESASEQAHTSVAETYPSVWTQPESGESLHNVESQTSLHLEAARSPPAESE